MEQQWAAATTVNSWEWATWFRWFMCLTCAAQPEDLGPKLRIAYSFLSDAKQISMIIIDCPVVISRFYHFFGPPSLAALSCHHRRSEAVSAVLWPGSPSRVLGQRSQRFSGRRPSASPAENLKKRAIKLRIGSLQPGPKGIVTSWGIRINQLLRDGTTGFSPLSFAWFLVVSACSRAAAFQMPSQLWISKDW